MPVRQMHCALLLRWSALDCHLTTNGWQQLALGMAACCIMRLADLSAAPTAGLTHPATICWVLGGDLDSAVAAWTKQARKQRLSTQELQVWHHRPPCRPVCLICAVPWEAAAHVAVPLQASGQPHFAEAVLAVGRPGPQHAWTPRCQPSRAGASCDPVPHTWPAGADRASSRPGSGLSCGCPGGRLTAGGADWTVCRAAGRAGGR